MKPLAFIVVLLWTGLGLRDNCYTWAYRQYFRYGGYVAHRRTRRTVWAGRGLFHHYLYSKDLKTWCSYVPKRDKGTHWFTKATGIPLIWFDGEVREGD